MKKKEKEYLIDALVLHAISHRVKDEIVSRDLKINNQYSVSELSNLVGLVIINDLQKHCGNWKYCRNCTIPVKVDYDRHSGVIDTLIAFALEDNEVSKLLDDYKSCMVLRDGLKSKNKTSDALKLFIYVIKLMVGEISWGYAHATKPNQGSFVVNPGILKEFAAIAGPLFLISGFIYNYLLLDHFNIKLLSFFSISDYLSSSIDVISGSVISAVFVMYYLIRLKYLKKSDRIEKAFVLFCATFFAMTLARPKDKYAWTLVFEYVAIGGVIYVVIRIIISKIFANSEKIELGALMILMYLGYIIFHANSTCEYALNKTLFTHNVKVSLKAPDTLLSNNTRFLTSNSQYIFMLKGRNKIIVLPKDEVKMLIMDSYPIIK
jgi:hypothetical protein